jgi:DNA repair protein RecN (Recombination protein N)
VLQTLHIRNLALVTELEVAFAPGFNAVTGETGAGKSLILGAVQLLLGLRAGPDLIRRGADQCEVSAVLVLGSPGSSLPAVVDAVLAAVGAAPCEDGHLLLRRVISASGSRAYANASAVTLATLRDLGSLLVDVHGPHEHQSLLRPRCQLELLDAFTGLAGVRDRCAAACAQVGAAEEALAGARRDALSDQEVEVLEFQVREIEAAAIEVGEEERLVAQHRRLANAQRLLRLAEECRQGLAECDGSLVDRLGHFVRLLEEMQDLDAEAGAAFAQRLGLAAEQLRDLAADLGAYQERFDLDPEACVRTEERLELVMKLKRRYGPALSDVLGHLATSRQRLEQHRQRGDRLRQHEAALAERRQEYGAVCAELTHLRQQSAGGLADRIAKTLRRLGFSHADFAVRLEPADPGATGADSVEFLFAPNAGEAMLPLRQIASSGEVARVMLAVKTVLSAADRVPVLIFDEVDANIGGRTAVTVAEELVAIAGRHQVLTITHLPQIAAAASRHFLVDKTVHDGRTETTMAALGPVEREAEIARMLGAAEGSQVARRHAREMLRTGRRAQPAACHAPPECAQGVPS